jgi:multicomponent Na+:H+ antiporter subunit A
VIAHAIAKSALFMTAGAVTEATGTASLARLGGLARAMPLLAVASGVAAATLAALPLTLGFFKDELFFAAAVEHGTPVALLAVLAAALTFAYIGRFWLGLFTGPLRTAAHPIPGLLVAPVALLAAIAFAGGIVVGPFAHLAGDAASVTYGAPVELHPAYHLDTRTVNVMAVAAWLVGGLILAAGPARERVARTLARAGDRFGPRHWYAVALHGVNALSDRVHDAEVRDMRTSLAAVLVPSGVLVLAGLLATPTEDAYRVGAVAFDDLPIVALLALVVAAAITVARDRSRLLAVLALSVLGFGLAAVYAVLGAPDVALVAVLVETILTLVFIGVFARLPRARPEDAPSPALRRRRRRNAAAGVVAGLSAFALIWGTLSRPTRAESDALEHIRRTPDAHGGDVVTVILADFRGFDTMVEITVLVAAIAGVAALLRHGRSW